MPRLSVILAAKFFVVLVCISLITIDGWRSWNAYELRQQETETAASNLARSLSRHADDTFTEADTVLVSLVERLEVEGTGPRHLARLNVLLKNHVSELPQLHGLFIYDENGGWLVNSREAPSATVNNSDRTYFIHHRLHADRAPHLGEPIQSRSSGEWILTITRRFNHPDGSFAGVVLATVYMDYFSKYYDTFDVGSQGTIILTLDNGTLLVRRPHPEKWIGQSMKDFPLFRDHLPRAPYATYMRNKSVLDGVERMTSYRRLDRYPMVAAVALSKDDIFSSWRTNTWQSFAVTTALAALLAMMGFLLIHHIGLHLIAEEKLLQAQEELQQLNRHLERIALQDGLTGLANRRQFDTSLLNEFNRAMRNHSSMALIMIDVDSFKQYNDVFGHPAGDECLKRISQAVDACQKRPGDLTARYGGEELAVLLPDTDTSGAFAVAEKIHASIRNLAIAHPRNPAGSIITVSCGVAALAPDKDMHIPMDLLMAADKALYLAKSSGRDQICCAPDLQIA